MSNARRLARLILPGDGHKQRVRNVATGRVLPCCYDDCERDGDTRHRIEVPHEAPRFKGEKVVYIFCGESHKRMYAAGTVLQRYTQ